MLTDRPPASIPNASDPSARRGRVLIVDDEPPIARLVTEVLETEGYEVWSVGTGGEAEATLERVQPDLLILDIMLPDTDGLVLCSAIRRRSPVPIVMLSATKERRDRILSLRLGADDFIAKPFDIHELIARIEAVLRRAAGSQAASPNPTAGADPPNQSADDGVSGQRGGAGSVGGDGVGRGASAGPEVYQVGQLVVDCGRRTVTIAGRPAHLTRTEYRLLAMLAKEPERVFSRAELAKIIWGSDVLEESRAVDVHIRRLRAKLEPFGTAAPPIVTVRGFGYKLGRDQAGHAA
jgi:DNA-binding response OmpR family regulator